MGGEEREGAEDVLQSFLRGEGNGYPADAEAGQQGRHLEADVVEPEEHGGGDRDGLEEPGHGLQEDQGPRQAFAIEVRARPVGHKVHDPQKEPGQREHLDRAGLSNRSNRDRRSEHLQVDDSPPEHRPQEELQRS